MNKRITPLLIAALVSLSFISKAQQFWIENWTGTSCASLCTTYTGPNGAWKVDTVGTMGAAANIWYFSNTEQGMGRTVCGSGSGSSATAHIGNQSNSPAAFLFCPNGDCGAAYDAGGSSPSVTSNERIESPVINCTGKGTITLSFNYIQGGQALKDNDSVMYFDGTTWAFLSATPKTNNSGCLGQGKWTYYSVALPLSANNNANVKIGFKWTNDDDGAGTDPSFAIDSIVLNAATTSGILALNDYKNSQIYPNPNKGNFTLKFENIQSNSSLEIYNVLGEKVYQSELSSIDENQINLANPKAGVYLYRVFSADRTISSEGKFMVK